MKKSEKVKQIIGILKEEYKEVYCELNYTAPHELLIATRLSAQCTDKRVNLVTPTLFNRYKTPLEFANANVEEVESIIKSCGLFKTKAKDIVLIGKAITEKYNGILPNSLEELLTLPGVGRKTANLIVGELYKQPAIVTDTHVIRLSNRLGLVKTNDPQKVEMALLKIVSKKESMDFCHRLVWHGRRICTARNPNCDKCVISHLCSLSQIKI